MTIHMGEQLDMQEDLPVEEEDGGGRGPWTPA